MRTATEIIIHQVVLPRPSLILCPNFTPFAQMGFYSSDLLQPSAQLERTGVLEGSLSKAPND
ncbi:MAG: hypothetical protein ACE5OZ_21960 [Candidatus Heimdallarchaeota archaeon]